MVIEEIREALTEEHKEHLRLWVRALRSGDYEQGVGALARLRDSNNELLDKPQYCCLGVACELALANGLEGVTVDHEPLHTRAVFVQQDPDNLESAYLPSRVAAWYGLTGESPQVLENYDFVHLTTLNDEGKPFSRIADLIEATYLPEDVKEVAADE